MFELKRTTSGDTDFQNLNALLEQYLRKIDGDEHEFYARLNKIDKIPNVVVLYSDRIPIGCGAFRKIDENTVEIKRMYVQPECRGKAFAAGILQELETWAAELMFSVFLLETGKNQPAAIRFYQKAGYEIIPNFGQYIDSENSVCMRKECEGV